METKFNVFEVLQIAEQIEHKGARFYLKTAELFGDPSLREIYYDLANWKAKHEKLWARMKKRIAEKTGVFGTFDPDNYVLSNPEVMAGLTSFGTGRPALGHLTGHENRRQILRDAVRRANEVIIFYQGLKGFAPDPETQNVIDKVIAEEAHQIELLNERLAETQTEKAS